LKNLEPEPLMKRGFVAFAVAVAVLGGTVALSALSTTHVAACPQGSSNC
jgi:hypothetical protein